MVICMKKLTEERSHIFVKELQLTSEKMLKYEKFTYVNIFGPKRKIVIEKQKNTELTFLLTCARKI